MQVQKNDIRQTILRVSREEFMERGFQKASMRTIAQRANVGLSNIYNYFENKDALFVSAVAPLLQALERIKVDHQSSEYVTTEVFFSEVYHKNDVTLCLNLYKNYKEELNLLFTKAEGSTQATFKEKLIKEFSAMGMEYLQRMKDKYPTLNIDISEVFVQITVTWWLNALEKLVTNQFNEEQVEQFMEDYVTYSTAGWKKLMRA